MCESTKSNQLPGTVLRCEGKKSGLVESGGCQVGSPGVSRSLASAVIVGRPQ